MPAEAEILMPRISHRPSAGAVGEHQYVDALAFRYVNIDKADGLRLRFGSERWLHPMHRLECRRAVYRKHGPARMRRFPRLARAGPRRALRCHATRQSKTMHLADHRISGHPITQSAGDLARAKALVPQFLEYLDPLFRPGQLVGGSGWVRSFNEHCHP